MNVVCLAIDRFHWGYLGAYGNTWNETPQFDRLAAESFLFDRCYVDTPQLDRACRSLWTGTHAYRGDRPGVVSLPVAMEQAGWRTVLASDDADVARHPLACGFGEIVELPVAHTVEPAESSEQTHLAQAFSELIEQTARLSEPFFLWCHLSSLGRVWDAPLSDRAAYLDGDDPDPPEGVEPPNALLRAGFDPDLVFGWTQAYAAQVRVLDTCLGAWADCVDSLGAADRTALALLGTRGFPLGEHRRLGHCDEALYAELAHVPLLLRLPGTLGSAARSNGLVYAGDLAATLWEVCQPDAPWPGDRFAQSLLPLVRGDSEEVRDRLALTSGAGDDALVTPAWYYRRSAHGELFVQPDDPWQESDVADRCADLVAESDALLNSYRQECEQAEAPQFAPLAHALHFGVE